MNQNNVLRLFSEGEVYDVTTLFSSNDINPQNNWQLSYDVLRYRVGLNMFRVFYRGREY